LKNKELLPAFVYFTLNHLFLWKDSYLAMIHKMCTDERPVMTLFTILCETWDLGLAM